MKSKSSPQGERLLIVNADDFGLSTGVNAAVARAHDNGILTSATLLTNAPRFDEAVGVAAARPRLGVGLHLNIVRGRPLSAPETVPLLTDSDGLFRRFRLGRLTPAFLAQAEREYRLQFEKILCAGITPSHIDFEKHHAWQAPLYQLACRLAEEYGVRAARRLREPVAWSGRALGWPGMGAAAMAAFLRCGFDLGGRARDTLARPDRLLGQAHIGHMTEAVWLRLARKLPPGASEVMTHPGEAENREDGEMGDSWLADKREAELAALVSPKVRDALTATGIVLINFRDLPSRVS